ncbi:Glu-tRNA(Gln) amidotransferase subunit GatD [Methanococcoides seepicolus]|jgi:glutamyl-tRNA(Gln) amidotransferase subunit D|uniref:Glutamyl-tRNA(Gln) amidotransferase subunit D n=1 Tax=Methanococcoides seepicolus TaxID=2828780 RepID=A0A9E4ZGY9_9EURY|nr:Glu-tRNA(Gln) amidotransferase subunit GatD [Methanococcoides seepicolus]MCM1986984.1 Glu-tRNA(Gln) amidotransferase subunit GatD [Methanococcoides seepicolus]
MDFELGDRIRIEKDGNTYEGVVMPSNTDHIVVKMVSGYNAGVDPEGANITLLEKAGPKKAPKTKPDKAKEQRKLPKVTILSTGGTIASKVDYRTGAVTAQFSADDIVDAIPELTEIADINGRVIYNILSENMKTEYWTDLAGAVAQEIEKGADGIIIAHGTDTMMYSAAALSFMLKTPVPIVFVGSQRSADRPSSDNAMNAICATKVAVSDIAEVCVVMHDTTCDDRCAIHFGTKVRKMHTSRRDAFQSINSDPIGYIDHSTHKIETILPFSKRGSQKLELKNTLEPKCALVKFVPGADPDVLSYYIDSGYKGLVIEGTGLGHVSTDWIPNIKRATESGIPVIMTSQCLNGRVCDRVYDTGRDILKAGAIEGEDMLPEVALVKLMWALGQNDDVEEIMRSNIGHEMTDSTLK